MPVPERELIALLVTPTVFLIGGFAFFALWRLERVRRYVLYYCAATLIFAAAVTLQIMHLVQSNAVVVVATSVLYMLCAILVTEGLLNRNGDSLDVRVYAVIAAVAVGLRAWFTFGDPNLVARVFTVNAGVSVTMLIGAYRLRAWARGRVVDRVLFWALVVFALHLLPRTMLAVSLEADASGWTFGLSRFWSLTQLSVSVLGALLVVAIAAATLSDLLDQARHERDTDALTGLSNRRKFMNDARVMLRHPAAPAALLACDLDHFKAVNDTYGHPVGDGVLAAVAKLLQDTLRAPDICGRVGGEEFLILLDNVSRDQAAAIADRLREAIARKRFIDRPRGPRVTASIGLAERRRGETIEQLFARADRALYEAKHAGRNTIAVAGGVGDLPTLVGQGDEAGRAAASAALH